VGVEGKMKGKLQKKSSKKEIQKQWCYENGNTES